LFHQTNLPFYFALLGPITNTSDFFPNVRMAQLVALQLPFTAIANTLDLGDVNSPAGSVHFRDKQPVGFRFSLSLWKWVYGHNSIIAEGPVHYDLIWPSSVEPVVSTIIRYDLNQLQNAALYLVNTENCTQCCSEAGSAFKAQLGDGRMLNSTIKVYPDAGIIIVITAIPPPVVRVTGIYHIQENFPQCMVKNSANIPGLPFIESRS